MIPDAECRELAGAHGGFDLDAEIHLRFSPAPVGEVDRDFSERKPSWVAT